MALVPEHRSSFDWLFLLILSIGLLANAPAGAQEARPTPCGAPEARQLDFWLGEWELRWPGGSGHNSITRLFGDCGLQEDFEGQTPTGILRGRSLSVFDARSGKWRQTWVDNQGSYLVFEGGVDEDGVMRLLGPERTLADGRRQRTRMSWVHVGEDALDWHWERSFDGGKSWEMVWPIHYTRAAAD